MGTVLWFHFQQVLAVKPYLSFGHLIKWIAHEHGRKRRFAGAIRSHDGMNLTVIDDETDAFQYFFVADSGV